MLGSIIGRLRDRIAPGGVVLAYHRVADLDFDPQLLAVGTLHFDEQMTALRALATPVPLRELRTRASAGNARGFAAVTFDDGYADNLHSARPVLERHGVPATVFVSSGYSDSGVEFWWDDLERILLRPADDPQWNVLAPRDSSPRQSIYREMQQRMKSCGVAEREEMLSGLRARAGVPAEARDTHRPMTRDELRRLCDGDLVEIGAHSMMHPMLSALDRAEQQREIAGSKETLEEITGKKVRTFAYPFGGIDDYDADSIASVRDAGFELACSNFQGTIRSGTDPYQFPRILMRDWDGDEFRRRLQPFL